MSARQKIDPAALRRLVAEGLSTAEIAVRFDVQSPAVIRSCHAHGIPLPKGKGSRVGRYPPEPTRAEDERDLEFLRAVFAGEGFQRTADRHGVSNMTVQRVVKDIEAADLAESGEPVKEVSRHYPRQKRGGFR